MNLHPDPIMRRLHACVTALVPVYMEGGPGTGKTSRTEAYARITGRHYKRWLLSRCEPIDLKPRVYHEGRVIVCDPPEIEDLVIEARKVKGGIAFYDELNRATRETENAALDRIDAPPEYVAVVAAGNPVKRGQSARALGSAAANRFCHLQVPANPQAWAQAQLVGWAADEADFPTPDADEQSRALTKVKALASAFIKRMPDMLDNEPDDPTLAGKAWPSPRSWEAAEKVYAVAASLGYSVDDRLALLSGCVGEGAAISFMAYCTDADLVDAEAWLADPKSITLEADRVDRSIAALTAVVAAVQSDFTEKRWAAAWEIMGHVTDTGGFDAAVVGGDMLVTHYRDVAKRDKNAVTKLTRPHVLMAKYTPRMATLLAQ